LQCPCYVSYMVTLSLVVSACSVLFMFASCSHPAKPSEQQTIQDYHCVESMSHDLGPGTFESHWFFLGYCDGVAGGLGKNRRKARGGLIPPWSSVLHGRKKKWTAWLYRIRRPTFILRMVADLTASAARTILKTCLRCLHQKYVCQLRQ